MGGGPGRLWGGKRPPAPRAPRPTKRPQALTPEGRAPQQRAPTRPRPRTTDTAQRSPRPIPPGPLRHNLTDPSGGCSGPTTPHRRPVRGWTPEATPSPPTAPPAPAPPPGSWREAAPAAKLSPPRRGSPRPVRQRDPISVAWRPRRTALPAPGGGLLGRQDERRYREARGEVGGSQPHAAPRRGRGTAHTCCPRCRHRAAPLPRSGAHLRRQRGKGGRVPAREAARARPPSSRVA